MPVVPRTLFAAAVICLLLAGVACAHADSRGAGRKGAAPGPQEQPEDGGAVRRGIRPSGLTARFPENMTCAPIASPYGSATRYDGSRRPASRFGGLHGGIDLTLEEGTPLRAIATGKVIHLGKGGLAEGIYLWLQHAPQDTGLPFWIYSKYQHLAELPGLSAGETVQAGQVIALSGKTGTVGPHYGSAGYPHLHLTTLAGRSGKFERQDSRIVTEGARLFDPVAVYLRDLGEVEEVERLPDERKTVPIPYVAEGGSIHPAGSRMVWPVACKGGN
jgi:murein DD-endopeptidase MepM/ murein hydrolase activator NlpD